MRKFSYFLVLFAAILLVFPLAPTRAQQIQLEVTSAEVTQSRAGSEVSITLSAESRRAFAVFSREAVRKFIEIRSAGDLLATVRLQTSIEGGILKLPVLDGQTTATARKLSENVATLEIRVLEEKK